MAILRCIVKEKDVQCESILAVSEPITEKAQYICRHHPDSVQRKAAGNIKLPRPDVHFQDYQFDPDLRTARRPQSTGHVRRQGSDTNDQREGKTSTEIL